MALNITNHRVEEKAVLACKITGKNKTATVEEALDYFLKHHRSVKESEQTNREAIQLLEEMSRLPVQNHRSADEILGYDAQGLSR